MSMSYGPADEAKSVVTIQVIFFSYNLSNPPFVESWAQGLVVLHNPNALQSLPRGFFFDAVQGYIENGLLTFVHPGWHPIASKTLIVHLGEVKRKMKAIIPKQFTVAAITKEQFREACGFAVTEWNRVVEEHGWFTDETESFLGVVIRDKIDDDWGYVVLGRDTHFDFRAIVMQASLPTRYQARMELQHKIAGLLSHPQRIFPEGSPLSVHDAE
jgi:hypothetical protein